MQHPPWLLLISLLLVGCPTQSADDDSASNDDDLGDDDDDDDDDSVLTWRSTLYPADWSPGFTGIDGATLHDFSYAGYARSERDLPDTSGWSTFNVTDYGADPTGATDSTAGIQAAIDAATGGGRVFLPAGDYRVDDLLLVETSGIAVVGAGPEATRIRFTRLSNMSDRGHLTLRGSPAYGPDLPLVEDEPSGSPVIRVADASSLQPGDHVDVGWVITDEFVSDHGMENFWEVSNGQWRSFFRREVLSVDVSSTPHVVTLDVPTRYQARTRDGASVRQVTGRLSEVGVEDLAIATAGEPSDAWSLDRSHGIVITGVMDGWVRNVGSFPAPAPATDDDHLASGGIKVLDSKRVTVADCVLARPQNRGGGGNGYLFEVSRSSDILFRDDVAQGGRHNFIQNWDFGTSGIVWLRTTSLDGEALTGRGGFATVGASEFHHSLAMANLIDASSTNDAWKAVNRRTFSSGAGHTATGTVFWNLGGEGTLTSFQYELGYVIGTGEELGVTTALDEGGLFAEASGSSPEDWREGLGLGATLEPASLFEDQLARRLAR